MTLQLNESSLSRVWQHFNDPDRNVAIFTAFRGEYDHDENVKRNRTLAAQIRQLGYGFFFVDGYWIENQGTPEEKHVSEDSIFVIAPADKAGFAEQIHKLGNEYNQDAVLVKDESGVRLIFKDGSEQELGNLQPGKLAQAYTKLRSNKRSNTFVFESERDDLGWIARLAGLRKPE
jgi:hypothetical protein